MISRIMPLSNIVRVSRHITYVGKGDCNTKGKLTSGKLSTAAVLNLLLPQASKCFEKKVFLKAPSRVQLFKEMAPEIPLSPQPYF
ncbi:hypothetical protein T12_8323 [Trichinella patagoniensis]|uniref:Uncharacterized protein n=1 Tax=Trichinella patagoniensis TaxID=990121 RepID=A0A0V0YWP8_9BILA|nr:hypothetical protein T12_8323 [Trichinella patagoniensis]